MERASMRDLIEVGLPGFAVGLLAGATAGGLAAIVGQPAGWAAVTALTLGVPLGLLGGAYGLLIAFGKVRVGGFAPAALYWLAGFPLARLLQEVLTSLILGREQTLPPDVLGFLAYQGIVSAGFAIGFLWLHERFAPRWWHRVATHNPLAADVFDRYAAFARSRFAKARAAKAKAAKPR
jgi:hypothetical protein